MRGGNFNCDRQKCPAIGATCFKCNLKNHLGPVCTKPQIAKPKSSVNEVSNRTYDPVGQKMNPPVTSPMWEPVDQSTNPTSNGLCGTVRAVMESFLEGSDSSQGSFMIRSASPETSALAITDEFGCIADNYLAQIKVGGVLTSILVDSGSAITTIRKSDAEGIRRYLTIRKRYQTGQA